MATLTTRTGVRIITATTGGSPEAPTSLRSVIELAVRAPSAWNTQPWRFRIGEETIDVLADRSRSLGPADPGDRELAVSCGAAIMNLRIALTRARFTWLVDLLPTPANPDLFARLAVRRGGGGTRESDLLYEAVPKRYTVTGPMRSRPIDPTLLTTLSTIAAEEHGWMEYIAGDGPRREAADLIEGAERKRWDDPAIRRTLGAWVRSSGADVVDGIDPRALGFGWFSRATAPSVVSRVSLGRRFARRARAQAAQAPALAVLGTRSDNPRSWLAAGQGLQRLLLRAAAEGVQAGFFSAPMQDAGARNSLAKLIGADGYPQLVLRLGYAERAPVTPRRPWQSSVA
ncbi:MAG: nitroreductase family protein [Phycisphaerales bacterium]